VLVQRAVIDGVEIVSIRGPVNDADALALAGALSDATRLQPRGVLVDLTEASALSEPALEVLASARRAAPGWPRPALVMCCDVQARAKSLDPQCGTMHSARCDGLAHVDDRSAAPRRRIELEHSPQTPARARAAAVDALADLIGSPGGAADADRGEGYTTLVDEMSLVVSELVTNAVRHAQPPVTLEIELRDGEVLVAVDDGSPGRPGLLRPPEHAEGGRGLLLVEHISAETGVRPHPPGKTVWASLRRPLD